MTPEEISQYIRTVPDFPKKGIQFKDITTAIRNPDVFNSIIEGLSKLIDHLEFDYIAAIESRGYLFGAPLAYKLHKGLVILRKPNKLPAPTARIEYGLEYGKDALEIHLDAIEENKKVLIIDDLLATGGTAEAACHLIEKIGAKTIACLFLIELTELSAQSHISVPIHSLLKY